jgi:hypothetical protein
MAPFGPLSAAAIHVYQPVNSEEIFAVEHIALSKLSILRAARLEAGMFTDILNNPLNDDNITPYVSLRELEPDPEINRNQIRIFALANGLNRMMRVPNAFALLLRYQTLSERPYRRAVEEFDRLKRLRHELPNEPIDDLQAEQMKPDPPLPNEPIEDLEPEEEDAGVPPLNEPSAIAGPASQPPAENAGAGSAPDPSPAPSPLACHPAPEKVPPPA